MNNVMSHSEASRISIISLHVGEVLIALYLFISGITKLINFPIAINAVKAQNILPELLYLPAVSLHAITAIFIAAFLVSPRFSQYKKIVYLVALAFVGISVNYLIIVINVNGWSGNCGCFPGIIETQSLQLPLVMDLCLLSLIFFFYLYSKQSQRSNMISEKTKQCPNVSLNI